MIQSLYIHIPFCLRKCIYCDFFSVPYDESLATHYVSGLIHELRLRRDAVGSLETIYVGGGTPTSLPLKLLISMMRAVQDLFDLTPARIATARDKLRSRTTRTGEPITPATVNRYLAALSIVCSTAVREWGWLDDNPLRKVKKLLEPRERVRFLSDEERERLLAACRRSVNPYLYIIVVLALSTGARKAELLGLRWPEVDLKRGQLALLQTKNGERRAVPVTGLALELLREHARVRRLDTDLVFPSFKKPKQPIVIEDPWHKAMAAAGIEDFRFHGIKT